MVFYRKIFSFFIIQILFFLVVFSFTGVEAKKAYGFFSSGLRFAVIADSHFYDPALGMEGQVFDDVMMKEIKLFRYASELLEATFLEILKADVDFLIIPGDLTKDGELSSHLKLAGYLDELRNQGVVSFVVPGNHDINNPDAHAYPGINPIPAQTIDPEDFSRIYDRHGYGDALFRDAHSLSYVVEPVQGFWLLAIDSCRYRENVDKAITGGAIGHETMNWIRRVLQEAELNNKMVIGFMHHAVLENFSGHADLMPDFILSNHEETARLFAESGLQMVFTGHTHVQDITSRRWEDGSFLLDIQTGSILTYPHPFRIVSLRNGFLHVRSHFIFDIPGDFGENGFYEYSRTFTEISARRLAMNYGLIGPLADLFVTAYMAHALGDEQPDPHTLFIISQLTASPFPPMRTAGYYLASVWNDPIPKDNHLKIFIPRGFKEFSRFLFHMGYHFRGLQKTEVPVQ